MEQNRMDIPGLEETIKEDFSVADLRSLEHARQFVCNWLPATGPYGGCFWAPVMTVLR
jgi:hypothetical protein